MAMFIVFNNFYKMGFGRDFVVNMGQCLWAHAISFNLSVLKIGMRKNYENDCQKNINKITR